MARENKGLGKRVRVGVANQKIVVRVVDLPPLRDRKELARPCGSTPQEQIPMPLDQAVVDFQPLDVVEAREARQRVVVVAARRDMIERLLAAVRGAGLRPEGIDLSAFAMIRALHTARGGQDAERRAGPLPLVGGLTNLAVAQGAPASSPARARGGLEGSRPSSPSAGGSRSSTPAPGSSTSASTARSRTSRASGTSSSRPARSWPTACAASPPTCATPWTSTAARAPARPCERAVLTGPAAGIPGFAEALEAELGLPVIDVRRRPRRSSTPGRLTVAAGLALAEARA